MAHRRKADRRAKWKLQNSLQKKVVLFKKTVRRERFISTTTPTISVLRQKILEMQSELALAIRSDNKDRAVKLIHSIPRSKLAREWAVYRTISSQGSRTPGINDSQRPITNRHYQNLVWHLWTIVRSPSHYKATPLKRIWLEKPSGGLRPISVPSYIDRCVQHLYLIILSVMHEEIAEPNSFGFRPFRSPGWAQKAVTLAAWSRKGFGPPKFAVELDIAKCFDTISHDFILKNVGSMVVHGNLYSVIPQDILFQWLKSGYVDIKGQLTPRCFAPNHPH